MLGEADSKKEGDGERNKGEHNDELLDPVAVEGSEQDQGVRPVWTAPLPGLLVRCVEDEEHRAADQRDQAQAAQDEKGNLWKFWSGKNNLKRPTFLHFNSKHPTFLHFGRQSPKQQQLLQQLEKLAGSVSKPRMLDMLRKTWGRDGDKPKM